MSKQISRASIPSQPFFFLRLFVSRVGGKKKSKFLPLNWELHSIRNETWTERTGAEAFGIDWLLRWTSHVLLDPIRTTWTSFWPGRFPGSTKRLNLTCAENEPEDIKRKTIICLQQ